MPLSIPPAGAAESADALVTDYWNQLLRLDPLLATGVGDERYDGELPDPSDTGLEDRRHVHETLMHDLAGIEPASLDVATRTALDIAAAHAGDEMAAVRLRLDRLLHVDHLSGPVSLPEELSALVRADTPTRLANYVERLHAIGPYLDAIAAQMQVTTRSKGLTAPLPVVDRVIDQARRIVAMPAADSPLLEPVPSRDAAGRAVVEATIAGTVVPAFVRYLDALAGYRPSARRGIGLAGFPAGDELYAATVRRWTSRDLAPSALNELGVGELARIETERRAILERLGSTEAPALEKYCAAVRARLGDRHGLLRYVRGLVRRGWEGSAPWFGRLPQQDCEVQLVAPFREADTGGAYYEPRADGRPGAFYVNAAFYLDSGSQLLHRLAATAFHEASPGHHFQVSIEQEQPDLPPLRRFAGSFRGDAVAEGWGLYAERLADEMGLYRDPFERLGRLHNETLRAVRLVVDPGIHAFGWNRQRAVATMVEAGIPVAEAELEVDRYAVIPGQALSYKIGEREIVRLRARFASDGSRQATVAFHDRLLALGTLPLASIERELEVAYRPGEVTTAP